MGVACVGRRSKRVAQKWVSLPDNGGLQKWRIRAGRGDFVISDEDLRVESEECEAPLLIENGWRVRRLMFRLRLSLRYSIMAFFNGFFFEIFNGEVLAGLLYRIRNSTPNRPAAGEGAAEHEGKKPEGLLPGLPNFFLPVPFLEIIQCISSLSAYVSEIFGFIHHHTPLNEIACDVIRGLLASCTDGLHHLLNIPFAQSQLVAAICGAAAPPPL